MDLALALVLKIMPMALKMAPALALALKMAFVLALKMALALALAVAPASPQASWRRLRLGECASVLAWCVCNLWMKLDVMCSVELKMRACVTSRPHHWRFFPLFSD
jgi:hypothetical protein